MIAHNCNAAPRTRLSHTATRTADEQQIRGYESADAETRIRPYKGWMKLGRVVRRGERGVRGLFHVDQTDVIPAKQAPAPKGKLFGKAKPHVVA